jgi:hypothetical protein
MRRALFFVFFVCVSSLRGQGLPSEGRDFYLGYLTPSYNRVVPEHSKKFFGIFAFVAAYQDTKVYVSYFDSTSGKESTPTEYSVQAFHTLEIPLDTNRMRMKDPGDLFAEYRSVHITSEHPISVMYYSQGACAGGEYLALPTMTLGRKYVVASYYDNPEGNLAMLGGGGAHDLDRACGYFLVIAAHDNTKVTIAPASTTQGGKHIGVTNGPGANGVPVPYTIVLQRGQCYLVKSHCESSENDISGSIIESDKPVGVIAGHENNGFGSVSGKSTEGRDYMVEQMLPHEYDAVSGIVTLPNIDSKPNNADGTGDNIRVYTWELNGAEIQLFLQGTSGSIAISTGRYQCRERFEVEMPASLFSLNSHKFSTFLIDIANQSSQSPFPRASMMTIVPRQNWRTSYLFNAPKKVDYLINETYINVVAPRNGAMFDSIYISTNGNAPVKLRDAGLSTVTTYLNIPEEESLRGVTYKLKAGDNYYVHSRYPFIVYNKGYQAFSSEGVIAFNGYEKFISYAAPAGYNAFMPKSTSLKYKVDSSCIGYDVKIWDTVKGSMIKAAMLLDDPTRDIIKSDSGDTAYVSKNYSFITPSSPYRAREIGYDWSDSVITLRITKDNPELPAEAYLYVASSTGTRLIHLENIISVGIAVGEEPVTITSANYGAPVDTTIVFRNISKTESYVITEAKIDFADPNALVVTNPPLPVILKPGDSLKVTLRIFPKALTTSTNFVSIYSDTCKVGSQAFNYAYKTGLIEASDMNFGKVAIGSTDCRKRVFVTNRGELPFTLQNYSFGFANDFSLTDASAKQLPKVMNPGDTLFFDICYLPTDTVPDSAELFWITNIAAPYDSVYKQISNLKGVGGATAISWSQDSLQFQVIKDNKETRRIYLRNNSNGCFER